MPDERVIVLKYGGSVLTDRASLGAVADDIGRWRGDGYGVVAVVSALRGRTDALIARCDGLPCAFERAEILSSGERESAALLGLVLREHGLSASVLSAAEIGLRADGDPLDADPTLVDNMTFRGVLEDVGIVVAPGYTAVDADGRTVVLGRGGSDLTALWIASAIGGARCRLVKDVDALYDRDPALPGPPARRLTAVTHAQALQTDGSIVQHKAIQFALARGLVFELGAIGSTGGTIIGGAASTPAARNAETVAIG